MIFKSRKRKQTLTTERVESIIINSKDKHSNVTGNYFCFLEENFFK